MPARPSLSASARALLAALVASLGACAMTPLPVLAQPGMSPAIVEGWIAQSRLGSGLAGSGAWLDAAGARLLLPAAALPAPLPSWLAERAAVGGFAAGARADDDRVTARHYGLHADFRLRPALAAARVEPLLSLGVGALEVRRDVEVPQPLSLVCPHVGGGAAAGPGVSCLELGTRQARLRDRHLALSPALGARARITPSLALRAELRDVIVFRGTPQHNGEIALGVSLR